jgi:hypothetical protein
MEKRILKAVHDDDLEAVLKALGLYGDLVQGKISCAFCRDTVSWDNLHSIIPDSGAVKCGCSRPECVKRLLAWIDERRS